MMQGISCTVYRTVIPVYWNHENERINRQEGVPMGCVEISNNDRVWEILYASVFLEGKEREDVLRRWGVTLPTAASMA